MPGDATATANNLMANELLFRLGFVSDIIMIVCFLLLPLALYVLLEPVNKIFASLMVILVLVCVPILMLNLLNYFAALHVLSADYMTVFSTEQLNAQALLYLDLFTQGYLIAGIFTSLWLLPLGYLVFKSSYFPRIFGVLLIIGPSVFLIDHFTVFLVLSFYDNIMHTVLTLPATIAEFAICGWLLVKGANVPE